MSARLGRGVEEVAGHPVELTFDLLAPHDAIDHVDRRELCVPYGLRVVFAEIPDQLGQDRVGDARQMRGRVRGVTAEAAVLVDQSDVVAGALQQICRGDSGDPGSDDEHVDGNVFF